MGLMIVLGVLMLPQALLGFFMAFYLDERKRKRAYAEKEAAEMAKLQARIAKIAEYDPNAAMEFERYKRIIEKRGW